MVLAVLAGTPSKALRPPEIRPVTGVSLAVHARLGIAALPAPEGFLITHNGISVFVGGMLPQPKRPGRGIRRAAIGYAGELYAPHVIASGVLLFHHHRLALQWLVGKRRGVFSNWGIGPYFYDFYPYGWSIGGTIGAAIPPGSSGTRHVTVGGTLDFDMQSAYFPTIRIGVALGWALL